MFSAPDGLDLVHKCLDAFFIHMVLKHTVVFEGRADNRSVGDRELIRHGCYIYAGVGENGGPGNGFPDVFEDLLVGLHSCGQTRDAEPIGTVVEDR